MSAGVRERLVLQAYLVWAERGEPAIQRFIQTGAFDDGPTTDVQPYDQAAVKQIISTGRFM